MAYKGKIPFTWMNLGYPYFRKLRIWPFFYCYKGDFRAKRFPHSPGGFSPPWLAVEGAKAWRRGLAEGMERTTYRCWGKNLRESHHKQWSYMAQYLDRFGSWNGPLIVLWMVAKAKNHQLVDGLKIPSTISWFAMCSYSDAPCMEYLPTFGQFLG